MYIIYTVDVLYIKTPTILSCRLFRFGPVNLWRPYSKLYYLMLRKICRRPYDYNINIVLGVGPVFYKGKTPGPPRGY